MTKDKTVTMSLDLAEKCLDGAASMGWSIAEELRVLLTKSEFADHCKQCADTVQAWPESKRDCLGKFAAPVVESQPIAVLSKCLKGPKAGEFIVVTELGATGNDIWSADIPVFIEPPAPVVESQEPVAWLAMACGPDGTVYRQTSATTQISLRDVKFVWGEWVVEKYEIKIQPLYTLPPAQVAAAVVLPDLNRLLYALSQIGKQDHLVDYDAVILAREELIACLDKVKELNR